MTLISAALESHLIAGRVLDQGDFIFILVLRSYTKPIE